MSDAPDTPPHDPPPARSPAPSHDGPPQAARSGPSPRDAGGSGRPDRGRRGPPRPAPARQGVEPAQREPPRPIELPFRTVRSGDEDWLVREGGLTAAGHGVGRRAPLMMLLFARAADPDRLVRETLVPAKRMDELSEDELVDALGRARPFREERERQEVFPDTRKRGSKGI